MNMTVEAKRMYWESLPDNKRKAASYEELQYTWHCSRRTVRRILHELSAWDNGDNAVLIRSAQNKGFYKTKNFAEILDYRAECVIKAANLLAPLQKIDRILNIQHGLINF